MAKYLDHIREQQKLVQSKEKREQDQITNKLLEKVARRLSRRTVKLSTELDAHVAGCVAEYGNRVPFLSMQPSWLEGHLRRQYNIPCNPGNKHNDQVERLFNDLVSRMSPEAKLVLHWIREHLGSFEWYSEPAAAIMDYHIVWYTRSGEK